MVNIIVPIKPLDLTLAHRLQKHMLLGALSISSSARAYRSTVFSRWERINKTLFGDELPPALIGFRQSHKVRYGLIAYPGNSDPLGLPFRFDLPWSGDLFPDSMIQTMALIIGSVAIEAEQINNAPLDSLLNPTTLKRLSDFGIPIDTSGQITALTPTFKSKVLDLLPEAKNLASIFDERAKTPWVAIRAQMREYLWKCKCGKSVCAWGLDATCPKCSAPFEMVHPIDDAFEEI